MFGNHASCLEGTGSVCRQICIAGYQCFGLPLLVLVFGSSVLLWGGQIGKVDLTPTRMVRTGSTFKLQNIPEIRLGPITSMDRAWASLMLGARTSRSVTGRFFAISPEHSSRGYISAFFAMSNNWLQSQNPSQSPAYDLRMIRCPLYLFLKSFVRPSTSCIRRAEIIHSTFVKSLSISLALWSTAETCFCASRDDSTALSADTCAWEALVSAESASVIAMADFVLASSAKTLREPTICPEIWFVLTKQTSSNAKDATSSNVDRFSSFSFLSRSPLVNHLVKLAMYSPAQESVTSAAKKYSACSHHQRDRASDPTSEAVRIMLDHQKRERWVLIFLIIVLSLMLLMKLIAYGRGE